MTIRAVQGCPDTADAASRSSRGCAVFAAEPDVAWDVETPDLAWVRREIGRFLADFGVVASGA